MLDACKLYLITPPTIDLSLFAESLSRVFDAGAIACLQLRLKHYADDDVLRAAEKLMPICHRNNTSFVINDRPDLAKHAGADGVHIGQKDASYADARSCLGDQSIVGITCHDSRHLALVAAEAGADYVAFGAFFPTDTKQAKTIANIGILKWWSEIIEVPCVAIGGITTLNCLPIVQAGADFIALMSGIWNHPEGPTTAVNEFTEIIASGVMKNQT